MTTRFYLKNYVQSWSKNGLVAIHGPTQLCVSSDINGYFIQCGEDPYDLIGFTPRRDLDDLVSMYTTRISVQERAYLGDIATGRYTNGDEKTSIVIGELAQSKNKPAREMTITAHTWGRIERAVASIRKGEITPVGQKQTVLEGLTSELSVARGKLESLLDFASQMYTTSGAHRLEEFNHCKGYSQELLTQVHNMVGQGMRQRDRFYDFVCRASFWAGNTDPRSMSAEGYSAAVLDSILDQLEQMYKSQAELERIKATRWYCLKERLKKIHKEWQNAPAEIGGTNHFGDEH